MLRRRSKAGHFGRASRCLAAVGWGLVLLGACERTPELKPEDCFRLCARFEGCAGRAELAECAAGCSAWQQRALVAGAKAELAGVLTCVERDVSARSAPCADGTPHHALVHGRASDPCSVQRAALTRKLERCQPGTVSFRQVGEASVELTQLGCGEVSCGLGPDASAPGAACSAPSVCSALCCECPTSRTAPAGARGSQIEVRACEAGSCVSQQRACELARAACPPE